MPRTRQSRISSPAHPEWGIQVRPFAVGFTEAYKFDRKRYDWDGLIYASEGVMSIQTAKGSWVVPPHRAVWVPEGVEHSTEVSPGLSLRTLFFRPRLLKTLPRDCCVVNVPPLLRELILHTVEIGMLNRTIPAHARLIGVLRDQIEILGVVPLQLPRPTEPRARRVAELLTANPGDTSSLKAIAKRVGASPRTIERLFQAQTRMAFGKWRERLRLLRALRLLAANEPVTNVALDLGYASTSAFIAMFKRAFGTTPRRYFSTRPARA